MYENLSHQPSEKLLIIPDIHNNYTMAEKIISHENPDKVIFLGDYFDDYNDTVKDAVNTSKWLINSLHQPNRVHLIGNHDLSYMTYNKDLKCSGYNEDKHEAIRDIGIPWGSLRLFCWVDDWLCTHAGMSDTFYLEQRETGTTSVQSVLELSRYDLLNIDDESSPHPFFQVGLSRGGAESVGGILWCHYSEFVDIPGVRQIFGHTRDRMVRHKKTRNSEHYCIDTVLNHYAVYQNHIMSIISTGTLWNS